jgi:hypothetical protein
MAAEANPEFRFGVETPDCGSVPEVFRLIRLQDDTPAALAVIRNIHDPHITAPDLLHFVTLIDNIIDPVLASELRIVEMSATPKPSFEHSGSLCVLHPMLPRNLSKREAAH